MTKPILLAAVLSLALAGASRAEDTADESKKAAVLEEARQHVARAKVHYDLGEFRQAAEEYILVYRLRPIPALLFNIAQSYRQAGEYEKARQFYKSYLRESPEAKNRAMIEQAIHEMDELVAKEKRAKEKPPNGVKEPAEASLPMDKTAKAQPEKKPAEVAKPAEQKPSVVAQKPAEQKPAAVAQKPAEAPPPAQPAVTQPAPKPPVVAMATPRPSVPSAATTSTRAPAMEEDEPIYKKWWLWTAVGVVAVGAGVAAMTMGGNSPPNSHYGTQPVFP